MNDLIRQHKQDYLAGLNNAKSQISAKQAVRENQIYAEKIVDVNEKSHQLDEALDAFIADETAKLEAKIQLQRDNVAAKKIELEAIARKEAANQAHAEVSIELNEIDREIAEVTKSLGA